MERTLTANPEQKLDYASSEGHIFVVFELIQTETVDVVDFIRDQRSYKCFSRRLSKLFSAATISSLA